MAYVSRPDPHARQIAEARAHFFAGRREEARQLFEAVLARDRNHPEALHFLGVIEYLHHRYDTAIALIRKALPQRRQDSELHSNLGLALQAAGQLEAAVTVFRRAVALGPQYAAHHSYLACALRDVGALDEAVEACNRALALNPRYALAFFTRAQCQLLAGAWHGMWEDHEWRIAADTGAAYVTDPRQPSRVLPRPSQWRSQDLSAARLLVLGEQGIGDELFFLRYAPLVRRRCAWLGYRASPKAAPLLAGADGLDAIFTTEALPSDADHILMLGDLPLLADTDMAAPPPALRLAPSTAQLAAVAARLAAAGPGPYLAVTWRAGPAPVAGQKPGRRKAIPLEVLAQALRPWPGTLLSVQRNPEPGELATLAAHLDRPVADFDALNEDLPGMLALMALVDEYVGVSNTNMYLRAACGRAARALVTAPTDWRWTERAPLSPWFADFQLYREHRETGWAEAGGSLERDLRAGAPQR